MTPSSLTGEMVRKWREKLGLSQAETAEKMGISEGSLRNYEHEKRVDKPTAVLIPLLFDWAMSAVASGLRPFSENFTKRKK